MAKTTYEVAQEVISGKYGNGQDRVNALNSAGYDAGTVQNVVNQIVDGTYKGDTSTSSSKSSASSSSSTNLKPSSTSATKGTYGSYQYGTMPTYTSKYQDQIDKVTNQLANYGSYTSKYQDQIDNYTNKLLNDTYNPEDDALYQNYKDQYVRGGQKAMQDTMAKAVALSGGFDNSYANSVGQQTYNDYMSQLADKIPELAQLAQNMYSTKLSTLQGLDNTDYSRWTDDRSNLYNLLSTYNTQESDNYSKWQNEYSNYLSAYEQMKELEEEAAAKAAAAAAASSGGSGGSGSSGSSVDQDYVNGVTNYAGTQSKESKGATWGNMTAAVQGDYNSGNIDAATRNATMASLRRMKQEGNLSTTNNNNSKTASDWTKVRNSKSK